MTTDHIIAFLERAQAGGYRDPRLSTELVGDEFVLRFSGERGDKRIGAARAMSLVAIRAARFDIAAAELAVLERSLKLRPPLVSVPEGPR